MAVSVSLQNGGDAVVYQTPAGVFFDLLDASLAPVALAQPVSASPSSWVDATARAGGFTIEWLADGQITAEDFSAAAASLDSPHRWQGPAPAQAPLAFASDADGSSITLPSGGSVTGSLETAQNQYLLHVQQYDAHGAPDAPEFTLTAAPISQFGAPVLASLADGGYVAEYAVNANYAASLYLERFSAQGAPQGDIAVAHYGGLVSLGPSDYAVAGLPDGGFVAAWSVTNGTPGAASTPEAWAEEFTASGTGLGLVDLGASSGKAPVVDALADGHYAIDWTSASGANEHQVFTEAGPSLGAVDPPAPAGASSLLGGQTWAEIFGASHGGTQTVWQALSAALPEVHALGAATTPDPAPAALDPASTPLHDFLAALQAFHTAAHDTLVGHA